MRRPIYRREDRDGMVRELFLPWWWPLYLLLLRAEQVARNCDIDPARIERAAVWHGRWRIVPKHYL